ncbi:XRE family transcriptional regulator [Leptolyngbyaceae cyanobacterium CCMR0082]|uniref:XRE family transcriptional regulator n=2 Tax=Adonisia TaxID=2950183 RepID=A0A6M0RYF6_9CYAN|nr:XRE family transcriptional regulator [Adonisia turfae CCMR0082]
MCLTMQRLELPMTMDSQEGLDKLAEIVRTARESRGLSLRKFADLVDVSHGTIDRIEKALSDVSDDVLEAISEVVPYTYVELKAISQGRKPEDVRAYVTAEDVFEIAASISKEEQIRLMHMLLDHQ